MYSSAAMSVASTLTNTVQFTSFECTVLYARVCIAIHAISVQLVYVLYRNMDVV